MLLAIFLLAGGCKWGVPDYSLEVTLEEGVTGTPEAGLHTYKEFTTVTLSYTGINSSDTVEVFLNDTIRQKGSSSVVMFGDGYRLKARLVDPRGSWKITLAYYDTSITPPDPFIITMTGPDVRSGTFTDERGYHGTWTSELNVLKLIYWDWEFYVLTGTAYDFGTTTTTYFTFSGAGYGGTWSAVKAN
jgi:hypothetical protein